MVCHALMGVPKNQNINLNPGYCGCNDSRYHKKKSERPTWSQK